MNVVSFSGGRTSAYLVWRMEERRKIEGLDVSYVFMDTGAEHPKTYEFVRNVARHFAIDLICLKASINPELGRPGSYTRISADDIGKSASPWRDMLSKYGTPYNPGGAFCTDRLKLVPYTKYCNAKYGKGGYITWLGMRADEPKRLIERDNVKYLAEISDFDKDDIIEWWGGQPFDLDIPEHLGNCVFCIKKGVNKVALAAKDEPEMAKGFMAMLESDAVRIVERRKSPSLEMYRGRMSLRQVIASFGDISRDELFGTLRRSKRDSGGACSESCEIFSGQQVFDW